MLIKMNKTLDVSPDGIRVATFAEHEVYMLNNDHEREADLAQFLLSHGHATLVAVQEPVETDQEPTTQASDPAVETDAADTEAAASTETENTTSEESTDNESAVANKKNAKKKG